MRTPKTTRPSLWMAAAVLCLASLASPGAAGADQLRDARAALQQGRLDDATRLFEKAAGQGLAEGRAGVGLVWLKRHQYAKATEAFELSLRMDPALALGFYGTGEVLRQQDKCGEAVKPLQRAVELDRKFPEAQLSLADCLTRLGRYDEAIASANRGLGWGSRWRPKFLIALGNISAARDSLRDASIWYTTAVQESPEDPATHRALGDFYVKRGTFELAYPEYQAAVARDTSDVGLHFALGQALFYGQRYNHALEEYRWVVANDPEFPAGQLALGDLLYRSGKADPRRYAEAREPLEKYVLLNPDDPKGWSVLGRTLYFLGQKDQALEAMDKAERLGDRTKELFTVRARLHVERREFDAASADYVRGGSEMAPEDMLRMAQMMVFQKNTAKAESLYQAIVGLDSTSRSALFALGELGKLRFRAAAQARDTLEYANAVALFQRRIALDPNSDEAYYYIGLSYKEMKQYPAALEALRQAAALADGRADRHFWLGIMYQQLDSLPQARGEFERAVELDTTCGANKALALRSLGYFRLIGKDHPEATRLLELSTQCNDKDVQAWVWLAQAWQNSGSRAKAIENYKRVLALDSKNQEALKGLKSLEVGAKQGGAP